MNPSQIILLMICGCMLFMLFIVFSEPFKLGFRFLLNSVFGCAFMWVANALLVPTGVSLGVNVVTACTVGILGLPGFLLLYAARFILAA